MAVTIKDVAKEAGVSPSTVSRVLNKTASISDEVSARILEVVNRLGYVPNDIARSFTSGTTRAIAVVIDSVDVKAYANDFFNMIVFGIETEAHENDYDLIISNGARSKNSSVERLVMGKRVDGIIFPVSLVDKVLTAKLDKLSFPYIVLGNPREFDIECAWVDVNNEQAGALAVRHLHENGYRRIAFMESGEREVFNQDRLAGYKKAIEGYKLGVNDDIIGFVGDSVNESAELVRALLTSDNPPDAIVCGNQRLALGALRGAKVAYKAVPQDFGIVCFDNTAVTELSEPSITSLDIDMFDFGVQTAKALFTRLETPNASVCQMKLSGRIVARESTRKTMMREN